MIMNSTQILEMNINRDSQPPGGRLLAFGPLLPSHDMHLKKKKKKGSLGTLSGEFFTCWSLKIIKQKRKYMM